MAGSTVTDPPSELRLQFTQPLRLSAVRVALRLGTDSLDSLLTMALDPADASVVIVRFARPLGAGAYTADWRVIGADGHPVTGSVPFTVLGAAPGAAEDEHADHDVPSASSHRDSALGVVTRTLGFVALLLTIGAVVVAARVLPHLRVAVSDEDAGAIAHGLSRVGSAAAALSLLHALARLTQQVRLAALDEIGLADWTAAVTTGAWGAGFTLQVAGSVVALLGFRRRRVLLAALGVTMLAIVPALSGHAIAQSAAAVVADAVHVAAAGAWLGTLAVMALLFFTPALRGSCGPQVATTAVRAFSPLALITAGVVMASGAANALWRLGAWPADLTDPYVRWLAGKLVAVAVMLAIGAYNWRRVLPRLDGSADADARLSRSAWAEVTVGLVILVLTAVLVFVQPPAFAAPLSPAS